MISQSQRRTVLQRLAAERGRLEKEAPLRVCLAYPSPYRVAMSSLGFQAIYAAILRHPESTCERAFLPEEPSRTPWSVRPFSYESLRELAEFPVVAFSVAYELELSGLIRMLEGSKIGALRERRASSAPLILAGGPLTFSNPLPLGPFVDAVVMGEAEEVVGAVLDVLRDSPGRDAALAALAKVPHVWVPEIHGDATPGLATCSRDLLPARSAIVTPDTELSNMFLIEVERGCSRGCKYCVMRRTTNGGMRIVPKERLLDAIPREERRVGLVGAAVSDHPQIVDILRALAERGAEVGLSSLRPDRLKAPLVEALRLAGYRTLTTALDGASERLRDGIDRRGRSAHYQLAAALARQFGMTRLKLYLMLGLPGETDEDIAECAEFVSELSRTIPIALGISPFCAKRNTPLDGTPFAGVGQVQRRLKLLRRGLRGRADVRATSARWAWIEHVLSQGGQGEGYAAYQAIEAGGRFADFAQAFSQMDHSPDGSA